jgi:membrane-bound metal-dependent hydrolase YbcI (DUF457 family)
MSTTGRGNKMPITPLHFGLALPLLKKREALVAFIVPNIILDIEPVFKILVLGADLDPEIVAHYGTHLHSGHHIGVVLVLTALCWLVRRTRWVAIGAFYGGVSHILVDALVHTDVPLWGESNPIYIGMHAEVSIVLAVLTVLAIAKLLWRPKVTE